MKRYNFHLPEPLVDKLREEAKRTGLTMAETIRNALAKYVANSNG